VPTGNQVGFDRDVPLLVAKVGHYPLHHGGVGAIRTLGRAGVPVYAVTEDRFTPAALSRHLTGRFVARTTGLESASELLDVFSAIGKELDQPTIALPTDDEAAVFLAEHADDLAAWFILPEVPPELPRQMASKQGLHELCEALDVPVPRAVFPTTRAEVEALADELAFPVVAKNVEPYGRLDHPVVEFSTVIWTREHLLALVETWPDPLVVMLQEYIPREHAEDWIYHAYLNRTADVAVGFTGVKYRSWPPRAGVTSYARIVGNPALAELSADLCKRIGFRGIVDLDWRYDRRDQQYKLLDFNPRVGAQFRLFETTAGIDVVRAMHLDLTGRPVPTAPQVTGRGFSVEILDAPARVAAHVLEPGPVAVPHAPGRIEPGWFARDDVLPFVMAAVRASAPMAARVRQLARDAFRKAQTATARPRAGIDPPIRRAAKSAPWTNRMSGPNVGAAEMPLKYSPGTDDSNEASSNGAPATLRHDRRRSSLRKPSESSPTR
jgi:predicted ATP-grasp superfamily ATP-dependent carboligase